MSVKDVLHEARVRRFYRATRSVTFYDNAVKAFEIKDELNGVFLNRVVFYGSSLFREWKTLESDMKPLNVLNRGFGGAQLHHLIHNAERLAIKHNPPAIVIHGGNNDLDRHTGKKWLEVYNEYTYLLSMFRQSLPEAKIFVISVMPNPARWEQWPEMQSLNAKVREWMTQRDNMYFNDTTRPFFTENGELNQSCYKEDGLHFVTKGYTELTKVFKPVLLQHL